MKSGILVVSFGTSHKDTREKNIEALVAYIREKTGMENIYQAYTSNLIRRRIREEDSLRMPDVKEALEIMKGDGVQKVYILPTHIIDGIENHKMKAMAREFGKDFILMKIGEPLLHREQDFEEMAKRTWDEMKDLVQDDVLLFMGHGSAHTANRAYGKLENAFHHQGRKKVFVYTVEGEPDLPEALEKISVTGEKRVVLAPFMFVAGEHAKNDMAGETGSAASLLRENGYRVEAVVKGLGEYPAVREWYLQHLSDIMEKTKS